MEFLKLYEEENRDILYSMSWLNKNSIFDKSTGSFKEIDLFTFLENVNEFDYNKDIFYDDIYYILEYTKDNIIHIINNINKEIKREHKILPISQAKEFDHKTLLWLSRQDGRTIKEKLKNNKIKAVKRYKNVDTYENRIFKIFLKKLVLIFEAREKIQNNDYILHKIRQWLRSEDAKNINEYGNIVYNNILLHHPHYSKIFKGYKWLNRLDEKVQNYKEAFPSEILSILTFDILSKIQFKTKILLLASNLKIDYDSFNISFNEAWLPENIDLENNIAKLQIKSLDEVCFDNVLNLVNNVINNQLNIKLDEDRTFNLDNKKDEIYIDLFRLFPIAQINKQIIKFPISLKQKIDGKIVNANNTKIINLNHEVYSMPEILKTYDLTILKYFLEDFSQYFDNRKINYIIPDYVNVFEFTTAKKVINSYLKNNRVIPKSILAGLKYVFNKNVNINDTLLYIQKNHDNDIFVTPLLVKYDEKLKSITNGFYLERHPTKKLDNSNDIINSLNKIFPSNISEQLLSKFLQNGIKGLKEEKVVLYHNKEIIKLNDLNITKSEYNNLTKIKKLYHKNNLFSGKSTFIDDDKVENLKTYERLLNYEVDGFILWREHLPDLSMEIVRNGYFDEFVLVDANIIVIDKKITITDTFIIPRDTNELSFPLIFDNQKIDYIASLKSKELPFKEDVECNLELIYDYENEDMYQLSFVPLDTSILPIKVQWQKEKEKVFKNLIYPRYPNNPLLEDNIEDEIIKEFKQLEKDFKAVKGNRFYDKAYYFLKNGYSKAMFSKYWQNGNTVLNSQNNELKALIQTNLSEFVIIQENIPYILKNNIYLFLSYIHQDLIVSKETIFIIKQFIEKNHLYGLSIGCITTEWQKHIFKDVFKLEKEKQVQVLNIALWRCDRVIEKISINNIKILLDFIGEKLKYFKNEKNIVTYLEFLLASLRTKRSLDINLLHPNELITKNLLDILKSRSQYFIENYELESKISFGKIDKPDNLQKMPDLLYAVIYYLSNEDIENKIVINEITS